MVTYRCDLFKDAGYGKGKNDDTKKYMQTIKNPESEEIFKEYKNYCVVDDSSKFAAAVFYYYINKEILKDKEQDERIAYGIDLWETKSTDFLFESTFLDKLLKSDKFEIHILDENGDENIYDKEHKGHKQFQLQEGDLLCGNGNVDFYIGNNKYVGWGIIHKQYYLMKKYVQNETSGYFYNMANDNGKIAYKTVVRVKGGYGNGK